MRLAQFRDADGQRAISADAGAGHRRVDGWRTVHDLASEAIATGRGLEATLAGRLGEPVDLTALEEAGRLLPPLDHPGDPAHMLVRHGLAAAMHLGTDTRYHLCECRGFGPRVAHALVETFTDPRDGGGRALAVPRLAGHYAENLTGLAWNHDRSVTSVFTGTSLSLGVQALLNIGRELTRINPDIHP